MSFEEIFKNKKILITGHTGFKGSWLSIWLNMLGAKVYGYSLDEPTNPSHYQIANLKKIIKKDFRYDIRNSKKLSLVINFASISSNFSNN